MLFFGHLNNHPDPVIETIKVINRSVARVAISVQCNFFAGSLYLAMLLLSYVNNVMEILKANILEFETEMHEDITEQKGETTSEMGGSQAC